MFAIATLSRNERVWAAVMYFEEFSRDVSNRHLALIHQEIRVIARSPSHVAACTILASAGASFFVSALYLMKTACGIDLIVGPSPIHYLFF